MKRDMDLVRLAHGPGHAASAAMLTQFAQARRVLLPPIPRRVLAAAALCACLFPAPCWSGEGLAEGESRLDSTEVTCRDFEMTLAKFTPLSLDEVRKLLLQALVAAGHPAISPLAQVVAEEPCYSRAKAAATRALGTLGDTCGIEAVAEALIKNQGGCYDHDVWESESRRSRQKNLILSLKG